MTRHFRKVLVHLWLRFLRNPIIKFVLLHLTQCAALPVQPEGGAAVQCLLVRDGFCLAAGAGRDCWLWTLQEGGTRLKPLLRLRGHYSAVLCADMDQLGNILTGSRDAQVMRPSCNQHQRPDN